MKKFKIDDIICITNGEFIWHKKEGERIRKSLVRFCKKGTYFIRDNERYYINQYVQ